MNLEGIISVSGRGGLYKIFGQSKSHLIVEHIGENKKLPIYSTDKVSALSDISIYTEDEDVALGEVFRKIYDKENGDKCIDCKEPPEALKSYLKEILPNYDEDRVYKSDIKKLFMWYNLLQKNDMLKKVEGDEGDEDPKESDENKTATSKTPSKEQKNEE